MPPSTRSSLSLMPESCSIAVEHIARLIGRRFECGSRDVRACRVARQPCDDAASAVFPVRRIEAGERGHDVDIAVVRDAGRELLDVAALRDHAEVVAQPLHERAGNRNRSFERVVRRLLAELIRDRGHEPGRRRDRLRAGVHQQKAAGAVRVLGFAGTKAGLARPAPLADRRGCPRWARRAAARSRSHRRPRSTTRYAATARAESRTRSAARRPRRASPGA